MKISIFGLGYVGAVTAACLARDGHEVIGVDVNPDKVALIVQGKSPIVEPGLEEVLAQGVATGQIRATTDAQAAVLASEVSLISVGTPPTSRGEPNLEYVWHVCEQIGNAIKDKATDHVVVLRSTVPPGTLAKCQNQLDKFTGKSTAHLAFNPEFLREGCALQDYDHPPYTIIGTESALAEAAVRQMYASVEAPIVVVKPAVAEMVKCVANSWHAAKVSFANEIGRVAKGFDVDGREVMNLIVQDTKLNISPVYLRPGFAYGGSCLPKDLKALLYYAKAKNIPVPLLDSLPTTNNLQIDLAVKQILSFNVRKIAVFGLAFKPSTDDLRESPAVPMVKQLLGEGCDLKIYDQAVYQAQLMGTNLDYIRAHLPHFEELLVAKPEQALQGAELAVVTYATPEFREFLGQAPSGTRVLDLASLFRGQPSETLDYHGIAW